MRDYPAPSGAAPTLVLAHGAGAGQDHPWVTGVAKGLSAAGIHVVTFDFPYIEAGRRMPDRGPVLEHTIEDVWRTVAQTAAHGLFASGKSMGARIASQVAARGGFTPNPLGLLFFGYPLHPPGRPNDRRDRHLPEIDAPMLFLQGTRDGFGSPDELRALVAGLPHATLELIDGGDHSLNRPKRQDPRGEALAGAIQIAAAWLHRHATR